MPNIAALLKSEISRVARREIRAEVTSLKKAAAAHRHEIAALKQRLAAVEKNAKRTARAVPVPRAVEEEEEGAKLRFRSEGFAAHRKRLGLSAEAMGALVGASGQSVYKWESGKVKPRAAQLKAIAAIRRLGKREAQAKLDEVRQ